jgi:ribosome-associated protein
MNNQLEQHNNLQPLNIENLKDFIINILLEKKAEEVNHIDLSKTSSIAKYMIFASGRSTKNISAIADYLAQELKSRFNYSIMIEGLNNSEWIVIDLGDIIIHLFCPETREKFKLEDLWKGKNKTL